MVDNILFSIFRWIEGMESVPGLLPKGLFYLLYKENRKGTSWEFIKSKLIFCFSSQFSWKPVREGTTIFSQECDGGLFSSMWANAITWCPSSSLAIFQNSSSLILLNQLNQTRYECYIAIKKWEGRWFFWFILLILL